MKITPFSGTTSADKNGKPPVMLQAIAGKMPNRNVLSGTVAERAGIEIGKTYLAQVRENGTDKVFGTDYTFIKVQELIGSDIVDACKKLGPPEIFTVKRPEGFEQAYERKGDAVESLRTKRIKDGLYEPALHNVSVEHETAKEVIQGTTITEASDMQKNLTPEDLLLAGEKKDKK